MVRRAWRFWIVSLLSSLLVVACRASLASPAGVAAGVARCSLILAGRLPPWNPPCTRGSLPLASADASTFPDASGPGTKSNSSTHGSKVRKQLRTRI